MADLLAWIQITRPINGIIAGLGVFLGALTVDIPLNIPPMIYCFLAMSLLAMAGNVHNDLCDIEVDRTNQPNRPLPSERIGKLGAWFLTFNFLGYSLCFAWLAGPLQFYAAAMMALLLYFYNRFFKGWPLIGNLAVSVLCALAIGFPALGITEWDSQLLVACGFAFAFTLIREMIKDLEDEEGDRQNGLKTLAILLPKPLNTQITQIIWGVFALSLVLPYIFNIYGLMFLLLSSIFVLLPSIVVLWKFPPKNIQALRVQQKSIKWMMLAGMISIALDLLWPLA